MKLRVKREFRRWDRRRLFFEPLEPRVVLSGASADLLIDAAWFAPPAKACFAANVNSAEPVLTAIEILESNRWIVRLNSAGLQLAPSIADTERILDTAGADFQVIRGLGMLGLVLVRSNATAEASEASLAANSKVAYYELDSTVAAQESPDDPRFDEQMHLTQIDASQAWEVNPGNHNIVVAVVDSGVDYTHPDLANNIWVNPGEIPGDGIDNDRNGFVDDVTFESYVPKR